MHRLFRQRPGGHIAATQRAAPAGKAIAAETISRFLKP
jgi:hypothetical protein